MRIALAVLVLLALAVALGALLAPEPVLAEEEIAGVEWLTDLDAARAKARKSGRPILAVFR